MKKRFINRLAAFILFAMMGANLFSQGFYVYTKDGKRQDYASENVDSIVFYEKATENIVGNFINGHEYVDLGLPSGLKWATCNVGASKPEDYGDYYAWGETTTKSDYDWDTYKWCKGTANTMTKYCTDSFYGTVDKRTTLTSSDDVAHVKWGGSWRMPTQKEITELVNNCYWKLTTYNGVKGLLVTGPNGNSIFLPAAGSRDGSNFFGRGSDCYYWSATLDGYYSFSFRAFGLLFYSGCITWYGYWSRNEGHTVRPVTDGVENPDDENEEDEPIQEPEEEEEITPEKPADTMEAVDLGLPSGLKWATCNVGASSPEEYGGYYAWGETEEKSSYSKEDYKYYNNSTGDFEYIGSNISGTQYDVAHVKWGGSWRMPTLDEIEELVDKCSWKWTTYNGVNGQLVTGPNGNSIFLPAAGYRYGTDFSGRGSLGGYWSATLYEYGRSYAYRLNFNSGVSGWDYWHYRDYGRPVRPVTR